MNLGERLKELRIEKKMSQTELAKQFNIARSTLSQYESNQRTPSDDIKLQFAKFFNVSLDYLIGKSNIKESADNILDSNEYTIALHSEYDYDDLPNEAKKEIENFIEYIKNKYKK